VKFRFAAVVAAAALAASACAGPANKVATGDNKPATNSEKPATNEKPAPAALSAAEIVAASLEKTASVTTMEFEGKMSLPGPDGRILDTTLKGAVDNAKPLFVIEVDLATLLPDMPGGGGGKMLEIFDGKMLYVQFPEFMAEQMGGKRWMKIDPAALGDLAGFDLQAMLDQVRNADPTASFKAMLGAIDGERIVKIGTETVRGAQTTHLRATIDAAAALATVPQEVRDSVAQFLGDQDIVIDVWIDDDGLPRRMAYDFDFSKVPAAPKEMAGIMHFEMDIVSVGKPVEATIPAPSETVDFSELVNG
jgi:hypothetical protein